MKPLRTTLPQTTDRYSLGDAGLQVSPFCLGMVHSDETAGAAFDSGINFFFISGDLHWPLYETARRGLEKLLARGPEIRKQIVVAVASYVTQPEFCRGALEEALDAVPGLKSIDVAVIGGAYSGEFLTRLSVYREIRKHRDLGIKAIGTTFHDRQAALPAINHQLIDLALIRYNPPHPGARVDIFPELQPSSTLLYNFKSTLGFLPARRGLPQEYWQPDVTDYYRFALTRPEIDGLLCSPTTPQQVAALTKALAAGPLDKEEEKYLSDLAQLDRGAVLL